MVRTLLVPYRIAGILLMLLTPAVWRAHAEAEIAAARVQDISKMLPAAPRGLGEPITNRVAWDKLAGSASGQQWLQAVTHQLSQQFPEQPDDLYLEFSRSGDRNKWQSVAFTRRDRIVSFAIAECLENKGRFLPALESAIQAICSEPTWVYPAHDRDLRNFKGSDMDIDLGSSRVAWDLATADFALRNKLSDATRKLIRENIEKRIFIPYRAMAEGQQKENSWMRATHNWNSVCHAGVVGAALAMLESQEERAWFIAAAEYYMPNFLKGFGSDGYCSEGMAYWNYGFGHFLMFAETVRQATGGGVDPFAHPQARLPSLFGQRAEILNGIYPSIADCPPGSRPDGELSSYICKRLKLGNCPENAPHIAVSGRGMFGTMLFSFLPELPTVPAGTGNESRLRTWFQEGGVLICRPDNASAVRFAVSLKGGHNAEHHNHNDLGSFIVVSGNSMLLVDPGSEVYTARTFGSNRYESDVMNSFGHSVPVIAGKLQRQGADARAVVIETNFSDAADKLTLDLTSAYTVPTLQKLERSFEFRRGQNPSLTVQDNVSFTSLETFETALVTWSEWKQLSPLELLFTEGKDSVHVRIDTKGIPFEITSKQLEADVTTPKRATRLGLKLLQPLTNGIVRLTITPHGERSATSKAPDR
jgi:hypothetical protein